MREEEGLPCVTMALFSVELYGSVRVRVRVRVGVMALFSVELYGSVPCV